MSEELKTLKAIMDYREKDNSSKIVGYIRIKTEAIKWIKMFKTIAKFKGIKLTNSDRNLIIYVFKCFLI